MVIQQKMVTGSHVFKMPKAGGVCKYYIGPTGPLMMFSAAALWVVNTAECWGMVMVKLCRRRRQLGVLS